MPVGRGLLRSILSDRRGEGASATVDAAFFHEMEPNYHRPRISDTWNDHSTIRLFSIDAEEHQAALESVKSTGKEMGSMVDGDFVICCPTVRCFSFNDKLFRESRVKSIYIG